jgi:hypothetical protein
MKQFYMDMVTVQTFEVLLSERFWMSDVCLFQSMSVNCMITDIEILLAFSVYGSIQPLVLESFWNHNFLIRSTVGSLLLPTLWFYCQYYRHIVSVMSLLLTFSVFSSSSLPVWTADGRSIRFFLHHTPFFFSFFSQINFVWMRFEIKRIGKG